MAKKKSYHIINLEKIIQKVPNRFMLAVAAAKRSKLLKDGVKPYITVDPEEELLFVHASLKEIELGKIVVSLREEQNEISLEEDDILEMDTVLATELEDKDKDKDKDEESDKGKSKSKSLAA